MRGREPHSRREEKAPTQQISGGSKGVRSASHKKSRYAWRRAATFFASRPLTTARNLLPQPRLFLSLSSEINITASVLNISQPKNDKKINLTYLIIFTSVISVIALSFFYIFCVHRKQ